MAIVIACLAMAKPYYTLYYNFMIIIYFYLNQETVKHKERQQRHSIPQPLIS